MFSAKKLLNEITVDGMVYNLKGLSDHGVDIMGPDGNVVACVYDLNMFEEGGRIDLVYDVYVGDKVSHQSVPIVGDMVDISRWIIDSHVRV